MIRAPGFNAVLNGAALVRQVLSRRNTFEEVVTARRRSHGICNDVTVCGSVHAPSCCKSCDNNMLHSPIFMHGGYDLAQTPLLGSTKFIPADYRGLIVKR